ncbi:MAG: SMI1/KNR4 family protein [Myxococcales bacterium]
MTSRPDALRARLVRLSSLDSGLERFGAQNHHYRLGPVATEAELAEFEAGHGVKLPAEYRDYLREVSDGGAGPFYGLFSLESGLEAAKEFAPDGALAADFPLDRKATSKFLEHRKQCLENGDDDEISYPEVPEPCPGLVYLAEYGCGWSYALVVRGELAGTVWFIGEHLSPVLVDDRPVSFLEWMEDWVDGRARRARGAPARGAAREPDHPQLRRPRPDGAAGGRPAQPLAQEARALALRVHRVPQAHPRPARAAHARPVDDAHPAASAGAGRADGAAQAALQLQPLDEPAGHARPSDEARGALGLLRLRRRGAPRGRRPDPEPQAAPRVVLQQARAAPGQPGRSFESSKT